MVAAAIGLFFLLPIVFKASEKPISDPQKTICKIIGYTRPTHLKAPYLGVYQFTVNGKEYFIKESFLESYVAGDSFVVIYSRANPEENSICLDIPVFNKQEKVDTVSGYIIYLQRSFGGMITYRYKVKKKWHERSQIINASILDQIDRAKTKEFKVIYLLNDPRRSLMIWQGQLQFM